MSKLAQQLGGQSQAKVFAKGGKAHGDAAMDKALIKKSVKPSALKAMKKGGKAGCCK